MPGPVADPSRRRASRLRRLAPWASALAFLVALAAIWVPEFAHWHVRPASLTAAAIDASRRAPADSPLDEIAAQSLRGLMVPADRVVDTAEQALAGRLVLPTFPPAPLSQPFDAADLMHGTAMWQLMTASLASVDVLLDGHIATQRPEFFQRARDLLLGFADHESRRWLDQGLLWNDHAISARVPVLAKFWRLQRQRPADPAAERAVLRLAARSMLQLAKADAYAWRTSHGILADLALLQLAAAFPELPEAALARRIGAERFTQHLDYWIAGDGVTLLHSAGYHAGSLYHFSVGLRLFSLNGLAVPDEWWRRYDLSLRYLALLRRPDGTLPMFGDTMSLPVPAPMLLTAREADGRAAPVRPRALPVADADANTLLPVSGNSVWWDRGSGGNAGSAGQTVATWAYHRGLGHKLADEMSVLFWSHGRTWVSNAGYWPYDAEGREQAEGWDASNAPHLVGERRDSERSTRVTGQAKGPGLQWLALERQGPDGLVLRRQLLRLAGADSWIVLDEAADVRGRPWTTRWTLFPDLRHQAGTADTLTFAADPGQPRLQVTLRSPTGQPADTLRGSRQPWGGWVVLERSPEPATTLVRQQPASAAWQLAVFTVLPPESAAAPVAGAPDWRWTDGRHWQLTLPTARGDVTIRRDGETLHHSAATTAPLTLALQAAPSAGPASAAASAGQSTAIRRAYDQAAATYRRFPEVLPYRLRMSQLALGGLLLQELALLGLGRFRPVAARALRWLASAAWLAAAWWLWAVYFAPR